MKGISTVGIVMLTVFLSLSAPAHAGTSAPYPIYGYVNYSDGAPADDALVTIYRAGDPLNNTTAVVGSSYGASGWWKADLYNIPPRGITTVGSGDNITVEVADDNSNTGVTTLVVDTSSMGAHRVADVIIAPEADITSPIITNVANTTPTTNSVTITWDTDEDSDSVVKYGIESSTYTDTESNVTTTTSHSITLTGLSAGTTYYFVVNSTDASGNSNESDEYSFGTAAYPAPSITDWSNNKTNDNSSSITVNESEAVRFTATADQTIDTWNWYKDGADQSHNFDNYTVSWSVNGTYSVSVNATNANGTSNTIVWAITVNDITPPAQVTGLTNDTPTTTTVNLSWNANAEGDLAGYRVYQDGSLLGSTANTYYNVAGLAASTTYEFDVSAYDDNGLEGENASVTVTTAAPAPTYGVIISQPANKTTVEGMNATYILTVTNTGNVADTYDLQVTNIDGATTAALNRTTMALAAGASDVVALDVTNTTAGTFNVTVNATSQTYPTVIFTTGYIMTTVIETIEVNVTGKNFTAISGDANVTGNFITNQSGWVNVTGIEDPTISHEVTAPRAGLGDGDVFVNGVIIDANQSILDEMTAENGSIRIELRYTDAEIVALGITDENTIDIYKFNETIGVNGEWELVREQPYCNVSASGRNTTTNKVWVTATHLCTFTLVGSKPSPPTGHRGGGGDGTYPPGWFGTPTPTPTETPTAPEPTETTEPSVTTPDEEETVTTAAEGEATAEGTEPTTELKTPGFEAVFMIAGLLAVAYLVLRRRE